MWPAFKTYLRERYQTDKPAAFRASWCTRRPSASSSVPDKLIETAVDLNPAFKQAQGDLMS